MNKFFEFFIFCDGGFGNRLNTLLSGLAAARILEYTPRIFWPQNNWCQASFQDIFEDRPNVSSKTLTELAGSLEDLTVLLHDQIGADTLRTPFLSAYSFASVEEFTEKVRSAGKNVFYYPALIPSWMPISLVAQEIRECQFREFIRKSVVDFVEVSIGRPFHGLHLRRTDLNVGYTDNEVQTIVRNHPKEAFFVCSDDPVAEALAAVHPNVYKRDKQAYVAKRHSSHDWTAPTPDDDGRVYNSNIDRDAKSVVDGVIDMLILAHSSIIGFSGSTFQNMARMYGVASRMARIPKTESEISYTSINYLVRMLTVGALSLGDILTQSAKLYDEGRRADAIELEREAIEIGAKRGLQDVNLFVLHYNLAAHLINEGAPYAAFLYLEKALSMQPQHTETIRLFKFSKQLIGRWPQRASL